MSRVADDAIGVDDDVLEGLRAQGAHPNLIAALEMVQADRAPDAGDDFVVWEENWEAVIFFLDVSGEWNVKLGMAGLVWLSLNKPAIESVMRMRGIRKWQKQSSLLDSLQVMERAALKVLNKVED